ncbi:beta 1-4 rhamnosyltransferase Cps2T [Clostridium sp.]|jgi:rhamnosyltransferase|uniref:beta 1-4 rhamnosyltransferase Cps2T n=1 Tax=Clostridium sp. TaxID=1506 RepID=UPI00291245A6|nr:DUF1972 domain-containing protein [Clostridium sp.]MDU7363123.1 DUF1972 domain-containing protein [Clostridium sp.]
MKNVFIIGSKGIPANYGGFETFVDKLTEYKVSENIQYHVSCLSDKNDEFVYNNARCFNVRVPNIGAAKAVYYDVKSLKLSLNYIKKNDIKNCIIYILACRIGPFIGIYKRAAEKLGVKIYVNPDGHEWKRAKWNRIIRLYWKLSERLMVKHSDLLICDSLNIEKYIKADYKKYDPETTYIAYGADSKEINNIEIDKKFNNWLTENDILVEQYYLVVGRFVPENNYEIMINEFMLSKTTKKFVLISNIENNSFYKELKEKTNFDKDERIKFVGTVYDRELLQKIRENAYGYFHGHEVGGTNPSLLEALSTTNLNLLLDVSFNREVGRDGAVYFTKDEGNLANLINDMEEIECDFILELGNKAKRIIKSNYSWKTIVKKYEKLFIEGKR